MNRRKLLKVAGVAAASTVISAPAIAQSTPVLRWRLTTSFPKTLDTLYGACEMFAKTMADLSDQKFQISVYGPGEIVPAFQVFDAVANNTVEMGNSASIVLRDYADIVHAEDAKAYWSIAPADKAKVVPMPAAA